MNIEQLRKHAVYFCGEILLPPREVGLGWLGLKEVKLSEVGWSGAGWVGL